MILVAAGLVFFFLLLLGGLQYILSAGNGNQQDSQRAQRAITGAIAGLLIVFGIYTIMLLAGNFFGVNLLLFTITNV